MITSKKIQKLLPVLKKNIKELDAAYEKLSDEDKLSKTGMNAYVTMHQIIGQIKALEWVLEKEK